MLEELTLLIDGTLVVTGFVDDHIKIGNLEHIDLPFLHEAEQYIKPTYFSLIKHRDVLVISELLLENVGDPLVVQVGGKEGDVFVQVGLHALRVNLRLDVFRDCGCDLLAVLLTDSVHELGMLG